MQSKLPEHLDGSWKNDAECMDKSIDPNIFFPEGQGRGRSSTAIENMAIAICNECVVREECLEYALIRDESFGIWGGMSEGYRRRYRRRWLDEQRRLHRQEY